jgi:RNA polymerase II subunit A small phosphatase-like protein
MKKNLFLDIDNTLVNSVMYSNNRIKVYKRPYLDEFLDYVFKHFNVSIWTAANKNYAQYIINTVILVKPDRTLHYLLYDEHCKLSKTFYGNLKDLRLLTKNLLLPISLKDTYLLDDLESNCLQQKAQCINIQPYNTKNTKDMRLLQVLEYLKTL